VKAALDVGCGTGRSYAFRTFITVGYEPVFLEVNRPRDDLKSLGHWVVGSAEKLPFRDSAFDLVVASHVAEHLNDWIGFLAEAHRVLARGGILDLRVPNVFSVNACAPDHKHKMSFFKLYSALKRVGFRVLLDHVVGGRIRPRLLGKLLSIAFNLICEELRFRGVKD